MSMYRSVDIVVKSWRLEKVDNINRTCLEKKLGIFWDNKRKRGVGDDAHRE